MRELGTKGAGGEAHEENHMWTGGARGERGYTIAMNDAVYLCFVSPLVLD
jgi:hypothetical protein